MVVAVCESQYNVSGSELFDVHVQVESQVKWFAPRLTGCCSPSLTRRWHWSS